MRIGIGLPTTIPGTTGSQILEWARAADAGPFSSLGVLDRLLYKSYDPLISLTAAAAVTTRVLLATTIVISPLRTTAILAKQAASLDALSGGRLVLGLAVGARQDDYQVSGQDFRNRGRRFVEQLDTLRTLWEGEQLGPAEAPIAGPQLLIGGQSEQVFARLARYAAGYVHGGGPPKAFARAAAKTHAAWQDAGRPSKPQLWAQGYFALGTEAEIAAGRRNLGEYYAFTGPFAAKIVAGLLTSPQAIVQFIRGYEEAGCDELVLFPTVSDLNQLTSLAALLQSLGMEAAR